MKASNQPIKQRLLELRTMPYEKYLQTPEWREKRELALKRDGYRCRACDTDEKLHVHHRTYARRGNEDLDDLTTFCESCHEHFHKKMSQTEIMEKTQPISFVPTSKETQVKKWGDYLLGLLIQYPSLCPHVVGIVSDSDFVDPDTQEVYRIFKSVYQCDNSFTPQSFEQFVPQLLVPVLVRVIKDIAPIKEERLVETATQCATRLRHARLLQASEELHARLIEAAAAGDKVAERELRKQTFEIQRLMRTLDTARRLSYE